MSTPSSKSKVSSKKHPPARTESKPKPVVGIRKQPPSPQRKLKASTMVPDKTESEKIFEDVLCNSISAGLSELGCNLPLTFISTICCSIYYCCEKKHYPPNLTKEVTISMASDAISASVSSVSGGTLSIGSGRISEMAVAQCCDMDFFKNLCGAIDKELKLSDDIPDDAISLSDFKAKAVKDNVNQFSEFIKSHSKKFILNIEEVSNEIKKQVGLGEDTKKQVDIYQNLSALTNPSGLESADSADYATHSSDTEKSK
jgi:hypothetical protein